MLSGMGSGAVDVFRMVRSSSIVTQRFFTFRITDDHQSLKIYDRRDLDGKRGKQKSWYELSITCISCDM